MKRLYWKMIQASKFKQKVLLLGDVFFGQGKGAIYDASCLQRMRTQAIWNAAYRHKDLTKCSVAPILWILASVCHELGNRISKSLALLSPPPSRFLLSRPR